MISTVESPQQLMSDIAQLIEKRLNQKGWTIYRLTEEICKLRGEPEKTRSRYSSIRRSCENPESTKLETIRQILEVLDGQIVVRFQQIDEHQL